MAVGKDSERVNVTIPKEVLEWIDSVAERFNMTRSQVIVRACLDSKELIDTLDGVGLRPERVAKIHDTIVGAVRAALGKGGKKAVEDVDEVE